MKPYRLLLLSCLLFQINKIHSQDTCIVAGDSTLTHYTDFVPDETLTSFGGYAPPDTLPIDINNDGILDFKVEVWKVLTSFANFGNAHISAYGNNKILVNISDQTIADTLNNADTICSANIWKNWGYFFDYNTTFDSATSYYNYNWTGIADRYVGLKLVNPIDSAFGWVQIYITSSGSVIIKNYGCGTITPDNTSIPQVTTPVTESVIVFPNPTYDLINIQLLNYSNYEIKLYNDIGEIIYQNKGNQKIVDLTTFPIGMYILKIVTKDQTIIKKIIKSIKSN